MKDIEWKDLNPAAFPMSMNEESSHIAWQRGVLTACNMLNEMYSKSSTHPHLLGDCILAKLNLLKGNPRKNPDAVTDTELLDWLQENYFSMMKDQWDLKTTNHKSLKWCFFAPNPRENDYSGSLRERLRRD